jgi:tetratricopeptide (TPR) repeat protein
VSSPERPGGEFVANAERIREHVEGSWEDSGVAGMGGVEGIIGSEGEAAEVEAGVAGTDAIAMAIALDQARHDPELSRKVGYYVEKQSRLVDLQVRHFDEERRLAIAAAKRKRYLDRLRIAGATAVTSIGVAVLVGLIGMIWDAEHDSSVVLDAVTTPTSLSERGLTGAALATDFIGQLDRIRSIVARYSLTSSDQVRKDSGDDVKLEIPETGLSLQQVSRYFHRTLGRQRRMSVGLVSSAVGTLSLGVHIDNSEGEIQVTGPESDLDHLIREAGERTFRVLDPVNFVVYLAHTDGRDEDMLALARQLVATANDRTDRADVLGLLSGLEPDRALAERHAIMAESIAPESAPNVLMLARAERDLGHDELLLAALRRFVAKRAADQLANQRESLPRLQATAEAEIEALLGDPRRFAALDYVAASPLATQLARRAAAAARMHDLSLSRQLLQQALDAGLPSTEDTIKARWYADIEDGDWQSALGDARALLAYQERAKSENPVRAQRYVFAQATVTSPWLALAYAKTGNLAEARSLIDPTPTDCYACVRIRAEIAEIAGDRAESDRWFQAALGQGPSLPNAETEYASRLLMRGEPDRAIEVFKAANQKGQRFPDPLKGWGDALAKQGKTKEALEKYTDALKFAPHWQQLKDAREALAKQKS